MTAPRPEGWTPAAFAATALLLGLAYALSVPPFQVADEGAHLFRAYGVSRGSCVADRLAPVPGSLQSLLAEFPGPLEQHRPVTVAEIRAWSARPLHEDDGTPAPAIAANLYGCVPYAPAAAAIRAAASLGASPLGLLYAARCGSLLVYVALVTCALVVLPGFRPLVLGVALLPMSLHQAASPSADAMSNGLALLTCAYVLRLAVGERRIGAQQVSLLALLVAANVLCKANVALLGLVLLIPPRRFASRRAMLGSWALLLLVAALVLLAWSGVNRDNFAYFADWQREHHATDVAANLGLLRERPLAFLAAVARSLYHSGPGQLRGFVGLLGWGSVPLPAPIVILQVLVLAFVVAAGAGAIRLSVAQRSILAGVFVAGVLATYASAIVFWNPAASVTAAGAGPALIRGVPGRYFIPFALPLLAALSGRPRVRPAIGTALVLLAALALNAAAVRVVWQRYYTTEPRTLDFAVVDPSPGVARLSSGVRVGQTFVAGVEGLTAVEVRATTYGRRISGGALRLVLRSKDPGGSVVASRSVPLAEVEHDSYVALRFDRQPDSAGAPYYLEASVDGLPYESALGIFASTSDRYPKGRMWVNGVPREGDLQVRAFSADPIGR